MSRPPVPENVFLLGPDQWDDDVAPLPPDLPELPQEPYTPKSLRTAAARRIIAEADGKVRVVIMDPSHQRPGEDDADFFHRLEVEHEVDTYLIVVPMKAKVLGTVFEGGMLVRDRQRGFDPRIAFFPQHGYARQGSDGTVDFETEGAKGKRTRYLQSVTRAAQHVELWEQPGDLLPRLVARSIMPWP